jgi:SAM-dependent methyltransferase
MCDDAAILGATVVRVGNNRNCRQIVTDNVRVGNSINDESSLHSSRNPRRGKIVFDAPSVRCPRSPSFGSNRYSDVEVLGAGCKQFVVSEVRTIASLSEQVDRVAHHVRGKCGPTRRKHMIAQLSWDYLFDFSIVCELLAPRPDDRILDFAAGTCWAAESLARIGVRTVSIDLSLEMMRRGRQRLAADNRLAFRDEAAFVVARGQALPFADGSFDGVVCLNALHHLPSYAVALGEIHRVLKQGGRAVFSEPGSAHAAAPLSEFRMREESVIEKPVYLAHIRRLALDAGFTRMTVIPLRSASAYAFDYCAASRDDERLTELWDDTLRHSAREHARFALHKGDDSAADTLLPSHRLAGRLRADIVLNQTSSPVRTGEAFTDRLRITNAGTVTWKAVGRRFGGQVTCGVKVCDVDGKVLREDLGRTALPHDVNPGGQIELAVAFPGAFAPGHYELRYDMVVEGVTWFEFQGSPCARRLLEVAPRA